MDKWEELRDHAKSQEEKSRKLLGGKGNLITHVWRDVLNKMWSLDKKHNKEE